MLTTKRDSNDMATIDDELERLAELPPEVLATELRAIPSHAPDWPLQQLFGQTLRA
jgi:hypothetical protein